MIAPTKPICPRLRVQTFELWAAENADAIVAAYNVSVEARPAVTVCVPYGLTFLGAEAGVSRF